MRKARPTALGSLLRRISPPISGRTMLSAVSAAAVISLVGYGLATGQETDGSYQYSRSAQQGKNISPVPLNLSGRRARLVYLGSYIVNAQASCNSCHTCPSYKGIDPYKVGGAGLGNNPTPINSANYLSGGTPFGSIVAPSLTPDSSGLPGGLTYAAFKSAMLDGQDGHNPSRILQIMPWPTYRSMYANDVQAVYEYLSAIPPAPSGAGQCTGSDQTR
jgi:hypothetical protein